MRFRLVCLLTFSVPMLCLKDPLMGDDIIYPELLTAGVICWIKFPGCWQLKNKKNYPSKISNYLLKHNGVTIIYIYIYIYTYIYIYIYIYMKVVAFVVFERQTIEIHGWSCFSMLLGECGFCRRGFYFWRDFFFYSVVFGTDIGSLGLSNLKRNIFYRGFPWKQTFPIG